MNLRDAHKLPILAAMNVHPLHRRCGLVVLKTEVNEALDELSLETSPLPKGRLLDAGRVEHMLSESGITVELVKHRAAPLVVLSSPKRLVRLAARMVAASDPKDKARLRKEIEKAFYGYRVATKSEKPTISLADVPRFGAVVK